MRAACRILCLSTLIAGAALARPEAAHTRPRIQPVKGVTPGGLVYQVNPVARRLSLRTPLGTEVGSFPMQPDERFVAGVADDGSRVTMGFRGEAPSDDGMTDGRPARFTFRGAAGNVTASHRVPLRSNSSPVVFGAEVFSVAREKDAYVLLSTSASAPAARVGRVEAASVIREVGRLRGIRVHASGAGVIVEFAGAVTTIYFEAAGTGRLIRPDAALSCGNESHDQVFAWPGGVARYASRFERAENGFQKKGAVEWLNHAGGLVRTTELGELRELFPLPPGQLLVFDEVEARVLDDRGGVLSRAAFSTDEGVDSIRAERAAKAAQRMERLGAGASGADWVEAAIAANGEGDRFAPVARRDPSGVLKRFAREPDDSADLTAARLALATFLASRGYEHSMEPRTDSPARLQTRWDESIRTVEELVARGVPRWFRTQVSFAVLAARKERSPGWVTLAAAGAIAAGETAGLSNLPEEAFTPELAELTLALDRDRMDRLQREDPELTGDMLWSARSIDSDRDAESLRFHVPARRFGAALLACLPGAGRIRFQAVIESLGALGVESRSASRARAMGLEEMSSAPAALAAPVDLGDITSLLLNASRADDAELRAGAQLLFPLYGISLDAGAWRRDVLRRTDLLVPAACLLLDESLPPAAFTALFSETVLKARAASRDPRACALRGFVNENVNDTENEDEAGGREDPYCRLLAGAIRYGPMLSEEGSATVDGGRSREIAAWTRSSSAPSEIRIQARIARAQYGNATDAELLELWSDRDLPWSVRRMALGAAHAPRPSPDLASTWSRELRVAKRSGAEESALLSALHGADPDEAARIALERWENGEIAPGGEPDQAGIWVKALPASRVASDPKLRATLKALLNDDGVGPQIAAALARAGDAEALPPLMRAVRTGCLT